MRIFFSAGEASGDAYAEALILELKKLGLNAEFEAAGSARAAAAGAHLVLDTSKWGAIGILQAFKVGPRVASGYLHLKAALKKGSPGVFVPIDFGFVNIKLARAAKRAGWKVIYFIPPGSWKRGPQGRDLPQITDAVITPFPWSAEELKKIGVNVHFFGHPLKNMVGRDPMLIREGIAVFPGSRSHEIELNLEVVVNTLKTLGNPPCRIARASSISEDSIRSTWLKAGGDPQNLIIENDRFKVLHESKVGLICSGTATLEAALCHCPQAVVYRLSKWMWMEGKLRGLKIKWISLPNILLNRNVVKEFILSGSESQGLTDEVRRLMDDENDARSSMLKAYSEIDEALGSGDAIAQSAKLIASFADQT